MKHLRSFAVVLVVALCVTSLPGAVAGPLPQGGELVAFHKPAWGLSFDYPSEWTLHANEDSFVTFLYEAPHDGALFVIVRDDSWADPEYSLESIFHDIMTEVGGSADNPRVEPTGGRRTLAGVTMRVARFSGVDPESRSDLAGYVLQFTVQGNAYGVVAGSPRETWPAHRTKIDRVLRSMHFEAVPTAELPPTATPKPSPHAAGTYVSAREAVASALPAAEEWKSTATLSEIRCYNEGSADGGCRNWRITFAPGTDKSSEAYTAWVVDGQFDPEHISRDPLHNRALPPDGWIDSSEAMPTFLDNGGAAFLEHHPQAKLDLELREGLLSSKFNWHIEAIEGDWSGPGATLSMDIDPTSNAVDVGPRTWEPATGYFTAQEAAEAARKSMSKYPNAKMTEIFGSVQAGEQGYDSARCSYWLVYYHWKEPVDTDGFIEIQERGYSLSLTNGKVKDAGYATYSYSPDVTGDWGDSPEALAAFQATADYRAFAERFADPVWSFVLVGDEKLGHLWKISAELKGLKLEERFTLVD